MGMDSIRKLTVVALLASCAFPHPESDATIRSAHAKPIVRRPRFGNAPNKLNDSPDACNFLRPRFFRAPPNAWRRSRTADSQGGRDRSHTPAGQTRTLP